MRYAVRQKIFSIGDKFSIRNEEEKDIYIVSNQMLSFGKKLRMYDLQENELCRIEKPLFGFIPEYSINISGGLIAKVKKRFAFLKNGFYITSNNGEYSISGDFSDYEFNIYRNSHLIGQVSKKLFSFADTYGVEIDEKEDQLIILALAMVVDMVCHKCETA